MLERTLTFYFPMFPFDPPENIRKPKVFWCFQVDQKGTLGRKWLTKNQNRTETWIFFLSSCRTALFLSAKRYFHYQNIFAKYFQVSINLIIWLLSAHRQILLLILSSLIHLMSAIACAYARTRATSLMRVKITSTTTVYNTYCLGHRNDENEKTKTTNWIVKVSSATKW